MISFALGPGSGNAGNIASNCFGSDAADNQVISVNGNHTLVTLTFNNPTAGSLPAIVQGTLVYQMAVPGGGVLQHTVLYQDSIQGTIETDNLAIVGGVQNYNNSFTFMAVPGFHTLQFIYFTPTLGLGTDTIFSGRMTVCIG